MGDDDCLRARAWALRRRRARVPPAAAPIEAAAGIRGGLAERLQAAVAPDGPAQSAFSRDGGRRARAGRLDLERDRHMAFTGKLIVSKGVDLLVAAWPLVLRDVPDARLVVVGFGAFRDALERLLGALQAGDLAVAREIAVLRPRGRGRPARAAAPPARLPGSAGRWRRGLAGYGEGGSQAARACRADRAPRARRTRAGAGRLRGPGRARRSPRRSGWSPRRPPAARSRSAPPIPGLARVTAPLQAAVPAAARDWLAFAVDDGAVEAIAGRLVAWLCARPQACAPRRRPTSRPRAVLVGGRRPLDRGRGAGPAGGAGASRDLREGRTGPPERLEFARR